jgi:hypothetical protein
MSEKQRDEVIELDRGNILMWIVNGTLHLRVRTPEGDPVELNNSEVRQLRDVLSSLLTQLD